ncbi:hypothetical protein RLIN73S_01753 [Rhodanobacter lindaniclasticus]
MAVDRADDGADRGVAAGGWFTAPSDANARTSKDFDIGESSTPTLPPRTRPGEWLEYSPLLALAIGLLGLGWLGHEFATKPAVIAIANLNTYNFLFLTLGILLHWRPRSFLDAVHRAVPSTSGVLIQFPLYGGIAALLTHVPGADGATLAHRLSHLFVQIAGQESFPAVMGTYSAILGFFVPSGGGKWLVEAPYVMQAANDLHVHLGWAVQVYNAAEALPNLIQPVPPPPAWRWRAEAAGRGRGLQMKSCRCVAAGAGHAVAAGDDAGLRAAGHAVRRGVRKRSEE